MAGASAGLAFLARLTGRKKLARVATGNAFAAVAVSPLLLISDLGKPSRFFNMLRVFKVTSPMNVGSWILTANGIAVAPAAAYGILGWPRRIGRPAQFAAGALGPALAAYTATLISNTAVPAWSEARLELPFSFVGSAAASAGAAATMLTPPKHAGPARRLAIGGAIVEGLATEVMGRRHGVIGEPYGQGAAGKLLTAAKALTVAGA